MPELDRPVSSRQIRPALFISSSVIERSSDFLNHIFTALTDKGCRTALVAPPDCEDNVLVSPATEIIPYPFYRMPLLYWHNKQRLCDQLAKFGPNLLHCISEDKASLTRLMAQKLNLPYILTAYSVRKPRREDILSPYCEKVLVPGKRLIAHLEKQFPHAAHKFALVPMGAFVEDNITCFLRPERIPTIVAVHPFDYAGDFQNLITALKNLYTKGHEFMVFFIGSGVAEPQIRKLIAAASLEQIVNIISPPQPLRKIFLEADIFIQPAPSVNFNSAMLEAMSVGMAVASCRGPLNDMIIENETALVFNAASSESIRGTVEKFLGSPDFARRLAAQAQEYLKRNHTVTDMMASLITAYKLAAKI